MPELPEVETVARDLRPLLVGRTIRFVGRSRKPLRRPWKKAWEPLLCDRTIVAVKRRGKWLAIELDDSALLVIHLGMTGQLRVLSWEVPREDHTHLVIVLSDDNQLRFRDVRRFGSATYFANAEAWSADLGKLGPEPWDIPTDRWIAAIRHSQRNLKAILLDQTIVAGVGNIYADESCFAAGILPTRTGESLTAKQAGRLLASVRRVMEKAIDSRGSTIRDYIGGSGLRGQFQEEFAVYGRNGQPCRKCATIIEHVRLAGRSTHYCPKCQT